MTLWRRVLRRRALEHELDAELRDHLEHEVADRVRSGEAEADVRREIRLRSGGLDQIKEDYRDALGIRLLDECWRDVRSAVRSLAATPMVTRSGL